MGADEQQFTGRGFDDGIQRRYLQGTGSVLYWWRFRHLSRDDGSNCEYPVLRFYEAGFYLLKWLWDGCR